MGGVFEDIIKPGLDCIPILEVMHSEWQEGTKFRVTQRVTRNVFNAFDRGLSDHLAATTGTGFPGCQVRVEVVDLQSKAAPQRLAPTYHDSVPHALLAAASFAFSRVGPVEIVLQRGDCNPGQILPVCQRRKVDEAYLARFQQALGVCDHLGATAFLRLSGEFNVVEVAPPGGLDPVTICLQKGTILVPSVDAPKRERFEWPISQFADYASGNISAQTYLAGVRHAIMVEKETAIQAFRALAEQRIHDFDRALAGRRLSEHWLTGALNLVARLTAGLGEGLGGISDDARGMVLDWCAEIRKAEAEGRSAPDRALEGADATRRGRATPLRPAV